MEMVVDAKGDAVLGEVRSKGSEGCSAEWVKLAGVAEGKRYVAHYDLGGRCRRVNIIYSIDEAGNVMAGSWVSQWPGSGTFRLIKQPKPP